MEYSVRTRLRLLPFNLIVVDTLAPKYGMEPGKDSVWATTLGLPSFEDIANGAK